MALEVATQSAPILAALAAGKPVVLGFFSEKSEVSRAARPAFEQFCAENPAVTAFLVDVVAVPDVHPRFEITGMPTVVLVRDGKVVQRLVGPQKPAVYARALKAPGAPAAAPAAHASAAAASARKPAHHVVVYTTDVCPWCVRVKSYLRQNDVPFREINVQRDPDAARRMVERSGQQGVPQLDIDGRVIVGFDKPRIDSLLGLAARSA
jgi:glutaredoxin-like YruB-family protein